MIRIMLLMLLIINPVYADDSLSALMLRMQSTDAVKISYQETRTLELFDHTWYGSGYMYSTPNGLMLREQLKPNRLLMAVNQGDLFYYDVEHHLRHHATMQDDDPLTFQFAVFKALITADDALLQRLYQIDFETNSERWLMTLTAKQTDSADEIKVSGRLFQTVDTIIIKQADGDLIEFMLKSESKVKSNNDNKALTQTIDNLYAELTGE